MVKNLFLRILFFAFLPIIPGMAENLTGRNLEVFVKDLEQDGITGNERRACEEIYKVLERNDPEELSITIPFLESHLESKDRQVRQFVSMLLAYHYEPSVRRNIDYTRKRDDPDFQNILYTQSFYDSYKKFKTIDVMEWPEPIFANLLEALEDDDINGNLRISTWVFEYKMLRRKETYPKEKAIAYLTQALQNGDWQAKYWAALMLCNSGVLSSGQNIERFAPVVGKIFLQMMSDPYSQNRPSYEYKNLLRLMNRLSPQYQKTLAGMFEDKLDSDIQFERHFCAFLLVKYYRNNGIDIAKWHPEVIPMLFEALKDDRIKNNLALAYSLLQSMPFSVVEAKLRNRLANGDKQESYYSLLLLAGFMEPAIEPEISAICFRHLHDDPCVYNAIAAYRFLLRLGKENLKHLLEQINDMDWQQAVFLRFLTFQLGVQWNPPQPVLDELNHIALQSGTWKPRQIYASAALYLTPDCWASAVQKGMPVHLNAMIRLRPHLSTKQEKLEWLSQWYWLDFLDAKRQ